MLVDVVVATVGGRGGVEPRKEMHDAGIQVFRVFPLVAAQTEMNLSLRMMALSENRHRKTPQAFASSVDDDAQLPAFGVWKSGERNERVLSPHSGSRIYGLLLLPSRSVACARTGVCNLLADALNHFSRCNTMRVCVSSSRGYKFCRIEFE